jgi:hypothetical protein
MRACVRYQRFLTEPSTANQLAAAWCLTNVAAGSHEHTLETLKAAPFLINFLACGDPVRELAFLTSNWGVEHAHLPVGLIAPRRLLIGIGGGDGS